MTEEFNEQTLLEIVDALMDDYTEKKMERSAKAYGLSVPEFKKLWEDDQKLLSEVKLVRGDGCKKPARTFAMIDGEDS